MQVFYSKQISMQKLERAMHTIKDRIYTKLCDMQTEYFSTPEPVKYEDKGKYELKPIKVGEKWGDLWDCAWFHVTAQVPPSADVEKLVLVLDINGEGCIFDNDGTPKRGITNINSEFERSLGLPGKRVVPFVQISNGNLNADFWIDCACNDLFGKYCGGTLVQAEIACCNDKIRKLYYDFWVLFDLLKILDKESARYSSVLYALDKVAVTINNFNDEEIEFCCNILEKELDRKAADTGLTLYAVGHAHMDLAWLWPIRETKRKAARTFATAIELLDRYPDYILGVSQPQQFLWVKENHPKLYDKIKQKVKEGRIELQGAMWVEPDLNLTSGESLVRQIIYGKKFWKEEFNQDIRIAHIPDVFGFNGALPQILSKSDIDYLLTIKMSWNKYNQFPFHTFNWEGIDGSKILVHMPPEGTYNSACAPRSAKWAETNYLEKGKCDSAMILYGIGDGGGGPGTEHLERLKRIGSLSGICPVKSLSTKGFFEKIEGNKENYPTYTGEMYLEKHQGTYTTQAKNKYFNRKCELLLKDAEFFCVMAYTEKNLSYPKAQLDEIWQEILLYQFHDILPGSSIKRVYDESVERYREIVGILGKIIAQALKVLGGQPFYNPNSFKKSLLSEQGGKIFYEEILPYSFAKFNNVIQPDVSASDDKLESKALEVVFDDNGRIVSIINKVNGNEALSAPSNVLTVYGDEGDCWDMEEGYLSKPRGQFKLASHNSYIKNGYAVREQTLVYNQSTIKQTIKINDFEKMVIFENSIDWQENFKFLKAEFNHTILADYSNSNCQFGNIKRSTHNNTPLEFAQDEICAHKYIDVSDGNHGFAILNDCKYGHNAKDKNIKLSLLRAQQYPGENADKGIHNFKYAIYLHDGGFEQSGTLEKSYDFNTCFYEGGIENFIGLGSQSSIVESVKLSEDKKGVVIRICEEKGMEDNIKINVNFKHKELHICSIDEKLLSQISGTNFTLKPFEILTLYFKL